MERLQRPPKGGHYEKWYVASGFSRTSQCQMLQPSTTVTQTIDRAHTEHVEQAQVQVCHRRSGRVLEMHAGLDLSRRAARDQDRQIVRRVQIRIGHPGAVEQPRV